MEIIKHNMKWPIGLTRILCAAWWPWPMTADWCACSTPGTFRWATASGAGIRYQWIQPGTHTGRLRRRCRSTPQRNGRRLGTARGTTVSRNGRRSCRSSICTSVGRPRTGSTCRPRSTRDTWPSHISCRRIPQRTRTSRWSATRHRSCKCPATPRTTPERQWQGRRPPLRSPFSRPHPADQQRNQLSRLF